MATLRVHKLTKDSLDLTETLPRILALSNAVFCADPESKYASLSVWHSRLQGSTAVIVYLTAPVDGREEPVAYLFAHPRTHDPALTNGDTESLHIWMAAVAADYRKGGCLGRLMGELPEDPTRLLTVCTTPAIYPDMWGWLMKRGWFVERELSLGKVLLSKESAS